MLAQIESKCIARIHIRHSSSFFFDSLECAATLAGGLCSAEGRPRIFIILELMNWKSVDKFLQRTDVPPNPEGISRKKLVARRTRTSKEGHRTRSILLNPMLPSIDVARDRATTAAKRTSPLRTFINLKQEDSLRDQSNFQSHLE